MGLDSSISLLVFLLFFPLSSYASERLVLPANHVGERSERARLCEAPAAVSSAPLDQAKVRGDTEAEQSTGVPWTNSPKTPGKEKRGWTGGCGLGGSCSLSSHLCLTSDLARKIPAGLLPCAGSSADSRDGAGRAVSPRVAPSRRELRRVPAGASW